MKITSVNQVPLEKVEMPGATGCSYRVAVSRADGAPNFAMRVFEVAAGGNTPLHQHPYEHEVFILEGAGTVWRDGHEVALNPGDILFIPADERHQFKNTGAGLLKFICLIPAEFQKC